MRPDDERKILKGKCNGCGPLAELPSAAPGTGEGSSTPFVGADANVGSGTRTGQGVKTEVAEPSNNCSSIIGRNKKEVERLKAMLGITPATQQAIKSIQ